MRTTIRRTAVASTVAVLTALAAAGTASADYGSAGNAGCLFNWANSAGYINGVWTSGASTYSNPSMGCTGARVRQKKAGGTFTSWSYDTTNPEYIATDSCACVVIQTQHSGRSAVDGVWYTWSDS